MPKINEVPLSDIHTDPHNANMGSESGAAMIKASIEQFGFVDAGVLDRNNVLIGGNQRTSAAEAVGMEDAIIIDHDGKRPIYIRLPDMDLSDPNDTKARALAYALNRTAQVSLHWNPDQTAKDTAAGLDLSKFFGPDELPHVAFGKKKAKSRTAEPVEMTANFMIVIDCADEATQVNMLKTLIEQGITCRALVS